MHIKWYTVSPFNIETNDLVRLCAFLLLLFLFRLPLFIQSVFIFLSMHRRQQRLHTHLQISFKQLWARSPCKGEQRQSFPVPWEGFMHFQYGDIYF